MNFLSGADANLANYQAVLAGYQAQIAPPSSFSDGTKFLLGAAALGILLIYFQK